MWLLLVDLSGSCNADSPLLLVLLGSIGSIGLNVVLPRLFTGVSFLSLLVCVLVWSLTAVQLVSFSIADYVYWATNPSLSEVSECTMQRELLEQNLARLAFHTYNSAKLYHFVLHVNRVFKGGDWQRQAAYGLSMAIALLCWPATIACSWAQGLSMSVFGWSYFWALLALSIVAASAFASTLPKPPHTDGLSDEEKEAYVRRLLVALRDSAFIRVMAPWLAIHFDKKRTDADPEDVLLLHRPAVAVREGMERAVVLLLTLLMTWIGLASFYYRYGNGDLSYNDSMEMRAGEHQSTAHFFTAKLDFIQQLRRILV